MQEAHENILYSFIQIVFLIYLFDLIILHSWKQGGVKFGESEIKEWNDFPYIHLSLKNWSENQINDLLNLYTTLKGFIYVLLCPRAHIPIFAGWVSCFIFFSIFHSYTQDQMFWNQMRISEYYLWNFLNSMEGILTIKKQE